MCEISSGLTHFFLSAVKFSRTYCFKRTINILGETLQRFQYCRYHFAEFISPFKMAHDGRKEGMKGGRRRDDFYLKEEE